MTTPESSENRETVGSATAESVAAKTSGANLDGPKLPTVNPAGNPKIVERSAAQTHYSAFFELYEQSRSLLEDFKWLLDSHPENKGTYTDGAIHEMEAALNDAARFVG